MGNLDTLLSEVKYGEDYIYVDLIEELEDCTVTLDEGLRYFKTSKRLHKLAEKLMKKAKGKREIEAFANSARDAAREFEKVEDKFAQGILNKPQARIAFDAIKKHYSEILKKARNKTIFNILKTAGLLGIVGSITATILFGWQPFAAIGIKIPQIGEVQKIGEGFGAIIAKQFESLKRFFSAAPKGMNMGPSMMA
jgi:hypothetical protein